MYDFGDTEYVMIYYCSFAKRTFSECVRDFNIIFFHLHSSLGKQFFFFVLQVLFSVPPNLLFFSFLLLDIQKRRDITKHCRLLKHAYYVAIISN